MLETTECVQINNNGKIYTDCMEFSLLRFLHLILYIPEELKTIKKSKFNTNYDITKDLKDFINFHPFIFPDADYYLSGGIIERDEWAKFLSDRDFFDYYRNDQCELFTNISNIMKFFIKFFNMELNINNYELAFNKIAKTFSTPDKKISIDINFSKTNEIKMNMDNILKYLSRPEDKYIIENYNKLYKIKQIYSRINIFINEDKYEWNLNELYFADDKLFENKFITGHSVIYNC